MSSGDASNAAGAKRPGPEGGKRAANRRRRIEQLVASALPLMLERGIEPVSIDDITRAAGVAKGSFYRYFADKEELVETTLAPLSTAIEAAVDSCEAALDLARTPDEVFASYQTLAMTLAGVVFAHPDAVRLYLQESRSPRAGARAPVRALSDRVSEMADRLSRFALERDLIRPLDPRVSALAVVGAAERLLFEALSGESAFEPLQASAALISLVLDGVRVG